MTVGMPAEIRSEEAEEIGGRGLVEFTEKRFPTEANPAASARKDRPGESKSAEEMGAATSTQAPGESDSSVDGAHEISWDDVAASVVRHSEPAPESQATGADRSAADYGESSAGTGEMGLARTEHPTSANETMVEEAAREDQAAVEEAEPGVVAAAPVPHADVGELDGTAGEIKTGKVVGEDEVDAGPGEPDALNVEPDVAADGGEPDVAASEIDPAPDAPDADTELDAAPEPETVSVEAAVRGEPPSREPLAPAATTATRTTVMPVREPVAPSAAGSYLDDPDQMITYWIRAALTVALVMFLLVVLFWALGKLGDSVGEVWALFKANP
jgi:hypothetical protein